jgi:uncharacterized protein YfaS (alpha-2-macroglobulin family)
MTAPRVLLLLALAAAGLGQGENEPYFSLNSNRTFPSGGKPQVGLSAWNVESLDFRVYRINNPVQFFQQLENPHEFGGRVPKPPHQPTLIERVHSWKRGLRAGIRRSLRAQFTEPPSAHFESVLPHQTADAPAKATEFAQAPLLNPQQVALTFHHPVGAHSRWDTENVDIPVKDRGVYLVEAVHGEYRAYTIVIVSDLVMITKTGAGRIVSFVADRNTGAPVPRAQLVLLGRDTPKAAAESGADGLAEILFSDPHPGDLRLVVQNGRDFAVNTLADFAFRNASDNWAGYLYTDRPIYRPGHTVHFKGVLRLRTPDGYAVPAGKTVSVEIHDPDQKPVYRKTLAVSATGAIRDDLTLDAATALGGYDIQVRSGDDSYMEGSFDVEEYKKPEYEVRVQPSAPRVLQGQPVQAVIDARYYFGEPVAGAKVKYVVYRGRYWFPLWRDPDDDDNRAGFEDVSDYGDEQVLEEEGQLDADGKLTVKFDTQVNEKRFDYRYRIEARVTDEARREIVGRGSLLATYGSYLVNAEPDRWFYQPGSRATFTIETRDYDSRPVDARVHLALYRWSWRDPSSAGVVVSATDTATGPGGSVPVPMNLPPQGGSYRLNLTSRTPEGRDVESRLYLYVSGGGDYDFGDANRRTVQIVPDKKSYAPGETAKVLVITGKPGTSVLFSVEGRDLRALKVLRSTDATAVYEIPVKAQDEPGIWVGASFVRKGNLYQGSKYIKVPPLDHQLNIAVSTDKPQYQPAQTAQYTLQVTDAAGKPVPRAELSLGVVDEAIYAIRHDLTQDPLAFFFGRDWNRVFTEDSFNYFFNGEAGKRRMRLASVRPPSRLAQLKPDRLVQPKVRKAFPDTAFWAADLITDAAGRAQAKVEFPDSLTTWRATTRGVTADTRVGAATLKTIVRKNLILRLAVPRFFVQGDEVTVSAIVHNYLASQKTARLSLQVEGLEILDGGTRDVQLLPRAETRLEWRVRAKQVRSATLTGKALTDEESDALELELPVNIPGVKLSEAHGSAVNAGGGAEFDIAFPEKVQPGSRQLSIRLAPSIAGSLFGALEYLTSFPYGCVEQTMSSFLPNIVVGKAIGDLGLKTNVEQGDLRQKIRAGLDRLYNFQHEDGGWGWWETDESHPFMTAYVVAGLVQAKGAGVAVDDERINRGAQWVNKALTSDPKLAGDLRAYMVYALTLAGDKHPPALDDVFERRAALSPYGLALLGLAFETIGDSRAAAIADALEKSVQQDGEQAWWSATRDNLLDFPEDASPEASAFAVKFLSHQRASSPLLPKAAIWLMNHRNEGYWWTSTKQTAMVIYGLTDYLKAAGELNPNLTATVFVNGQQVLAKKLDQATALGLPELTISDSQLKPGANHIRITTSGQGRLYYSARADSWSAEDKMMRIGTASLNVQREYFRLVSHKDGDKIVYDLEPLNGPAATGDTLAVRLTVKAAEQKYLLIEDPIPAGTEFIARDSGYEIRGAPSDWQSFFSRRELHDDRIAIFQTWFPQGQEQFLYLLKVVNPGVFQVSPARVAPMYQHGTMATTEPRRLEVK